jgi:hypothetical protein
MAAPQVWMKCTDAISLRAKQGQRIAQLLANYHNRVAKKGDCTAGKREARRALYREFTDTGFDR